MKRHQHYCPVARTLAPPAARTAYTVTEIGREALPILGAMARFLMRSGTSVFRLLRMERRHATAAVIGAGDYI